MSIVYTVGYEGTDIDRFIATLHAAGIRQLADVRAVALSRKKGFSKTKFSERLMSEGIEYVHFIGLGDPKLGREAARAGRHDEFVKIYTDHISSDDAKADLRTLSQRVSGIPTVLLCFERDPRTCHRSIIANWISKNNGYKVLDLYADEPDRYIRNAAKMPVFLGRVAAE